MKPLELATHTSQNRYHDELCEFGGDMIDWVTTWLKLIRKINS